MLRWLFVLFALSIPAPKDGTTATIEAGDGKYNITCYWEPHNQLSFFLGPDDQWGTGPTCKDAYEDWKKTDSRIDLWRA